MFPKCSVIYLILTLLLWSFTGCNNIATSKTVDGFELIKTSYQDLQDQTIEYWVLSRYVGIEKEILIPDIVDEIPILVIDDSSFYNCINLSEIKIGNIILKIGQSAFAYCRKLNEIIIPASVKIIKQYAFQGCPSLSIIFDSDNTEIEDNAFDKAVTMIGAQGSFAQKYAEKNGLKFIVRG